MKAIWTLVTICLILILTLDTVSSYKRHRYPKGKDVTNHETGCANWWCGAGKECQVGSDGNAQCTCIQQCPEQKDEVCGSDGQWYWNQCELERTSCLIGNSLEVDHARTACKRMKNKNKTKTKGKGMEKVELGQEDNKYGKGFTPNDINDYPRGVRTGLRTKDIKEHRKEEGQSESDEDDEDDETDEDEDEDELALDKELEEDADDEDDDMDKIKMDMTKKKKKESTPANKVEKQQDRKSIPLGREIKRDSSHCSPQEYEILKDNLLLYNHERMIGGVRNFKAAMEDGGDGPEAGKDYLLSLMFSHLDQNNDGVLEYEELYQVDQDESLLKGNGCSLTNLLKFDDSDHNGQLNINEFYTAFNKLYSVSVISLDKALETTRITATVGDNVEIKCDVSGSPPMPIVWRRYGIDLSTLNQDEQIRVFPDGTLYLNKIQLLHTGNYSCHAQRNQEVVQTHILSVQTLPEVKVMPHIVWEEPGTEVNFDCRVTGEPFPIVEWLKNDEPLPLDMSDKYSITGDGIRLRLKDIYFSDTGAYMCKAENSAGKRLDIGSLVVNDQKTPSTVQTMESQFFVFHDRGISVYDPSTCRIQHQIQGTDIIPGTQEYLCGERDHSIPCEWGQAIKVSSSYVYVSQPRLDRVLVISTSQMVVVDVVPTDRYPVELHYVPHLDQVWVECWRSDETPSQKTLQVIREGKEKRKHHTVHPEPIDSHFDLVENLFLPPDSFSSSQFRYGYVSHKNGRGLYKMDLIALRYIKSLDLTPYNCVPQHIQFSVLYGMVIVECFEPVTNKPTGELVLDALTDSVIIYKRDRIGRPYLSPDSRKLITVFHGSDGTTLLLQLVRDTGLEFSFDVKTSLNISDVTFFPSQRSHTYDIYASSVDKDDVLFVDLESGKVEMVSGVSINTQIGKSLWKFPSRPISSQGLFSKYLATPSTDSVFVLNGQSHTINCQIGGLVKPSRIVWL